MICHRLITSRFQSVSGCLAVITRGELNGDGYVNYDTKVETNIPVVWLGN